MIPLVAAVVLLGIYLLPLVLWAIIRSLSPVRLLHTTTSDRDFTARSGAVKAFLTGLGDGISGYDPMRRHSYRALTSFERPFYVEGACAGLRIAGYMAPWRARRNFIKLWRQHHQSFVFLLIIGLGFSRGLRTFWKSSIDADSIAEFGDLIDPSLQPLFFDGYAFQKFIFGYHRDPALLSSGLSLAPYIRPGFFGGAGRALWFLLPDFADFQSAISALPEDCRNECLAGFGLATGFAGCEGIPSGCLATYPPAIQSSLSFRLGLTTGLFARYYVEPDFLESLLGQNQGELLSHVKYAATTYHEFHSRKAPYEEWRKALALRLEGRSEISVVREQGIGSMA